MPMRGRYGGSRDFTDERFEPGEGRLSNLDRRLHDAYARQRDDEFGEGWYATFDDSGQRAAGRDHVDYDYLHWRSEQVKKLDADYEEWRKERRQKFSDDFDKWRSERRTKESGR
jgi:hypothetical protein